MEFLLNTSTTLNTTELVQRIEEAHGIRVSPYIRLSRLQTILETGLCKETENCVLDDIRINTKVNNLFFILNKQYQETYI